MTSSTPSSLSRYRPAILVLTGAAAAYAAWLLYASVQNSPPEGLHRSNAVRRPNLRSRQRASNTSRIAQRLQQDATPLGEFDFFGNQIPLDTRDIVSPAALRELASQSEPSASPEIVENRIRQLYDTFLDRLLGFTFTRRALSIAEAEAVTRLLGEYFPENDGLVRALQRHRNRFAREDTEAALANDGVESIAPTELSWPSDEGTEGDFVEREGQTLQRTLYHIAEDRARQEGVIHRGITCNGCDAKPIRGIRWRCANCPDFDLCSDCEATNSHTKTHIFYKIRVPAPYLGVPKQEPVYPGRPHAMDPSISSALRKRLVSETRMETEEIEALWDQFTCLAATEWVSDPNEIGWAIDRRAFNHVFVPRYSSFISAPNLIYDRIFAYFDMDHNALIGFEEFIKGLDGMHSTDTSVKLRIVFNGYDVDGDGFISRKDVLRIFRAHYAIEKEATRNYLAETAEELSVRGALDTIHSAQPLGSAFTQNSIPSGTSDNEALQGKHPEADNLEPVIDDQPDTIDREAVLRKASSGEVSSRDFNSDDIVRERWARRQFYTDEEEGLTRPDGVEDTGSPDEPEDTANTDEPPTPEHERPRGSRSSSRVRFQDDIDVETRSNASTSSRPIGERWGGYEIPEPEKDLGKEVLYQITQQAFNELLDPLFKDKEDTAMDAFATRSERRAHAAQIEDLLVQFKLEEDINKCVVSLGPFEYAGRVIEYLCKHDIVRFFREKNGAPACYDDLIKAVRSDVAMAEQNILGSSKSWDDDWQFTSFELWSAKLYRVQLEHELKSAIGALVIELGWLPSPSPLTPPTPDVHEQLNEESTYRDLTMPQFRPNSMVDSEVHNTSQNAPVWPDAGSPAYEDKVSGHFQLDFGNLFLVVAQTIHEDSLDENNKPESSSSTEAPSAHQQQPNSEQVIDPCQFTDHTFVDQIVRVLYADHETQTLRTDDLPLYQHHSRDKGVFDYAELAQFIRRQAFDQTPNQWLRLPFLASLETVEREISDRKGSGLLNFEEFVDCVRGGRLRFLESWLDWVSF